MSESTNLLPHNSVDLDSKKTLTETYASESKILLG